MRSAKRALGEVELDLGRYELRRSGRRVKLEKKSMELLIFLVGRREQMVSREDIVKKLWRSDLFIDTDKNLNNIVRKIRTALNDDSAQPRFIETVVGKGYRFIGPVRVVEAQYPRSDPGQASARAVRQENASGWDERSSLAILPLVLVGKATDDHGLCLGFADALCARLANLRGLNVLPTSAMLNMPTEANASEIASRLGVRFVVHGAIQVSKGQWRLSLEMFQLKKSVEDGLRKSQSRKEKRTCQHHPPPSLPQAHSPPGDSSTQRFEFRTSKLVWLGIATNLISG
jgi:DNA-binding winged helix-turn-helix (wHTH) protein